jgi:hypothetical protein
VLTLFEPRTACQANLARGGDMKFGEARSCARGGETPVTGGRNDSGKIDGNRSDHGNATAGKENGGE